MKISELHDTNSSQRIAQSINLSAVLRVDRSRLPLDITLGVLIGISESFIAISLVSLIFTGELSQHLPIGVSIALLSTAIVLLATSLLSTLPFGIGIVQDTPVVILALIVSAYVASPSISGPDELLNTVLTTVFLSTIAVGVLFTLVGYLKLGEWVRYVPYPVIGGFLAGSGWLITLGALGLVIDESLWSLSGLRFIFTPEQLVIWLPAVFCGLVIFVVMRKSQHPLSLPITLISLLSLFYVGLVITSTSLAEATDMGLLLGELGEPQIQLPEMGMLSSANWSAILSQLGNIGVIIGISLISLLLYITSLEVTTQKEVNIDKELRRAGITNLLSGAAGGMPGFLSLGLSTLSYRSGARSRIPGITAAFVVASIFAFGFSALAYFPTALLAGVILFIGVDFLYEWIVEAWRRFSHVEYLVILTILGIIAFSNFLIGVAGGLAIMIVMFVFSYSRIRTVQLTLSGRDLQSNVDRNPIERRWIMEHGQAVRILLLRGFLFFGTANSIVKHLYEMLANQDAAAISYLVLDFSSVTGVDTSAALSFIKIENITREHGIELLLTDLDEKFRDRLSSGGMLMNKNSVHQHVDLDRGLEWCETQLLNNALNPCTPLPDDLVGQLIAIGFTKQIAARLVKYLEPLDLEVGDYVLRKDEPADALYYIEQGRVSVVLEFDSGEQIRLRTLTRGATVGEMGLYSGAPRSASVIADEPTRLQRMTIDKMEHMTRDEPELLSEFNRWVAASLAERLAQKSRSISALHSG